MIYGLTGGIGCGKTTVLKIFKQLGWKTLDADQICHELYAIPDSLLVSYLEERWGEKVFKDIKKKIVNIREIAKIVFSCEKELQWLNSVIHPLILNKALKEIEKVSPDERLIFAVPLLFETGWNIYVNRVISVWAPINIQFVRLRQRGWSDKEIQNRMKHQMSASQKLELADLGIINNGSLTYLKLQCMEVNMLW